MVISKHYSWFILLLFICNCSTDVPANNPYDPNAPEGIRALGTLKGRVSLAAFPTRDESIPLDGIRIDISGATHTSARAEADGTFQFANLPSGTYTVTATYTERPQLRYEPVQRGGLELMPGDTVNVEDMVLSRPPLSPVLTEITRDTVGTMTVHWQPPNEIQDGAVATFNVYIRPHFHGTYSLLKEDIDGSTNSITINQSEYAELNFATTYYFKISAVNEAGLESNLSEESKHQYFYPQRSADMTLTIPTSAVDTPDFQPQSIQYTPSSDYLLVLGKASGDQDNRYLVVYDSQGNRKGCVNILPASITRQDVAAANLTITGSDDSSATVWMSWKTFSGQGTVDSFLGLTQLPLSELLTVSPAVCESIETLGDEAKTIKVVKNDGSSETALTILPSTSPNLTAFVSNGNRIYQLEDSQLEEVEVDIPAGLSIKALQATSEWIAVLLDDGLRFYPLAPPFTRLGFIPYGNAPDGLLFVSTSNFLLVRGQTDSISVVDTESYSEKTTFAVQNAPTCFATQPFSFQAGNTIHAGDRIFVPNKQRGELLISSLTTLPSANAFPLECSDYCSVPSGIEPSAIAVSPDGNRIAIGSESSKSILLFSYLPGDIQ